MKNIHYRGRFAPSPSGALHFGSLVAALGSFLRARHCQGLWLVRIEDIDPPREVHGAADDILRTLEAFGLHWDQQVIYQSQRHHDYQDQIADWLAHQQAYYCQCSRQQIRSRGGIYNGHCRQQQLDSGAIRWVNNQGCDHFIDQLQGPIHTDAAFAKEDFIIRRSDGFYAYQLAVVMDDIAAGITEVVRGADLLEATVRQISLFNALNAAVPDWLHLPLACQGPGSKLSKQNHATPVDKSHPQPALNAALAFLGQPQVEPCGEVALMIHQAIAQFDLESIPKQKEILLPQ
ncbi:tRNA glutamyl-Q(34) synthetase GluQRS [Shewanella sp. NIFS-20-20]|uniref:tRNA glutamyl-Q(34) synthetase GluQRS n=1 Tax=Shewanella sp. NIFS-20-20 TaxID=2853806 RepID=UPI001C46A8A3|nr:tRNA glutamyl-Q(34) synthetase GluQRS [Shewanella sp. NIFS-20-20]